MKLAVIIGDSSGIGQSAAIQIAERAAGVILTYITNPARANQTVGAVKTAGGAAAALPLDVGRSETFPDFVAQVTSEVTSRWQRLNVDHLVNNTGFGPMARFYNTTEEDL